MKFHFPKIISTEDGSDSLLHPLHEELYHSRFGAYTESQHVFIQSGLAQASLQDQPSLHVLEMGLGSGLNALLTWIYCEENQRKVDYVSIEKYPVHPQVIHNFQINTMGMPDREKQKLIEIHTADWEEKIQLAPLFSIHKIYASFEDYTPPPKVFDVLYYDAFAPEAQPELWTEAAMQHCNQLLKSGGIWISYCAKGYVKRNLRAANFEVQALPGPPRKREITLAIKK